MDLGGPGAAPVIPALAAGLFDDAAVFPPGNAPLALAVRAYGARRRVWYAGAVGPLVLPAAALPRLAPLLPAGEPVLPLAVTFPDGPAGIPAALGNAALLPVEVRAVEVAVPEGATPEAFFADLAAALEDAPGPEVFVEVPRDDRRLPVLAAIPHGHKAKFRTGGVRAGLHPGEAELAEGIAAAVAAGLPFKATAGLHHAVRNTDAAHGFEQHGFLNLLLATDALLHGGTETDARALLAERDDEAVADLTADLTGARMREARAAFTSFGTCSITEPLDELIGLGLVGTPDHTAHDSSAYNRHLEGTA
ncbi:hypothetical protein ACFQS3_10745 [Glycomyces mayteni]|uniref:Uncharacterized protein n=1 Tax=Glycomyces mayteni TaxID=543887 RepID=A0ABW2D679_9ACTN|nr:hypothetical protein GCM10025732_31660 [Glycomyces mayteni]